jgi:outer membrane protein OmpA-like peptidoglycan-associated protein
MGVLAAFGSTQLAGAPASTTGTSADTAVAAGAPGTQIPFVVGLSTVQAVTTPDGDYEALRVVLSIDASGSYRFVISGEVPGDDGELLKVTVQRKVLAADRAGARKVRTYFHTGDPETYSGTTPGFSAVVVNDLRNSGKTAFTFLDVAAFFGISSIKRELSGTLTRVVDVSATVPVLVNGRITQLRVIHAKGVLSDGQDRETFDCYMLDDPTNPITLRWSGAGMSSAIVKIDYPEPAASPTSIESALAKNEVAEVYGIYFSFNRADIRPESERVLKEIATVLVAHPDWKLHVDGHTDGIGNDAANLDLSKRRAAAVKAALVTGYHIDGARLTTGGYGESSPQATNETPEGRARNRRVELRRK